MALFEGRILITDCSNKDDRDAVIASILNHKSSRATVYVMLTDFKEINAIRQKFTTVVPFVLIPDANVERTRRMLKLLPHMDHFVNFLGQDLALEFLNKRSDFRIKSITKAYARSSVIDKVLVSSEQGIIFNINTGDNHCMDNVVAAGSAASKSISGSVKKMFGLGGPSASSSSSIDEREPLISKESDARHCCSNNNNVTAADDSTGTNNIWRFIVSVYYFLCPCINDARVILPVNEYPDDLDAKLLEEFEDLYESIEADWYQKLHQARHSNEAAIQDLQDTKEERVEKEYNRLIGKNADLTTTASSRYQAFVNVRNYIRLEKDKLNQEFEQKTDLLYYQHYHVTVAEQLEMMVSFWKKMRFTP